MAIISFWGAFLQDDLTDHSGWESHGVKNKICLMHHTNTYKLQKYSQRKIMIDNHLSGHLDEIVTMELSKILGC
jgi:hypothetical protein